MKNLDGRKFELILMHDVPLRKGPRGRCNFDFICLIILSLVVPRLSFFCVTKVR